MHITAPTSPAYSPACESFISLRCSNRTNVVSSSCVLAGIARVQPDFASMVAVEPCPESEWVVVLEPGPFVQHLSVLGLSSIHHMGFFLIILVLSRHLALNANL